MSMKIVERSLSYRIGNEMMGDETFLALNGGKDVVLSRLSGDLKSLKEKGLSPALVKSYKGLVSDLYEKAYNFVDFFDPIIEYYSSILGEVMSGVPGRKVTPVDEAIVYEVLLFDGARGEPESFKFFSDTDVEQRLKQIRKKVANIEKNVKYQTKYPNLSSKVEELGGFSGLIKVYEDTYPELHSQMEDLFTLFKSLRATYTDILESMESS